MRCMSRSPLMYSGHARMNFRIFSSMPSHLITELLSFVFGESSSIDEMRRAEDGDACVAFEWRQPGDLLIWDNARMLHRATTLESLAVGASRKMLRVSVGGSAPIGL